MNDLNKIICKGTFLDSYKLSVNLFEPTITHWALVRGYPTRIAADGRRPWSCPTAEDISKIVVMGMLQANYWFSPILSGPMRVHWALSRGMTTAKLGDIESKYNSWSESD